MISDHPEVNKLGEKIKKLKAAKESEQFGLVKDLIAIQNLTWSLGLASLHFHIKCAEAAALWNIHYLEKVLPQISKK